MLHYIFKGSPVRNLIYIGINRQELTIANYIFFISIKSGPNVIKLMLNSTEHEISTAGEN